ncbi:MAG: DUF4097 family beta strand repeat-containing protein [Bacteroidota bacterium]
MKNLFQLPSIILVSLLFLSHAAFSQSDEYKLDKSYNISANGFINMRTNDADIKIVGSNRDDVRVKVYRKVESKGLASNNSEFRIDISEDGGDLVIREKREGNSYVVMGYRKVEYKISIEAPKTAGLKINGDDDDYIIENIDGNITMKVDDGDVKLSNCNGSNYDFVLDDGDVDMDGGSGNLSIRLDDGDFVVKNGNFKEINAVTDDGDIYLETSLTNDGDYFFRTDDGGIDMTVTSGGGEFDIRHDDSRLSSSDDFRVIEKSEDETRLKLDNGTAKIRMRVNDSRIKLSRL